MQIRNPLNISFQNKESAIYSWVGKIYPSENTQPVSTCSNSTMDTPKQYVKSVQS